MANTQADNPLNEPGIQVDVRNVIEVEATEWQALLAQTVRDKSVLQAALRDRNAYVRELEAKVQALSGMQSANKPAPPVAQPPTVHPVPPTALS